MEDTLKKQENIRFSGASVLHQNGLEDRASKTVVTMVRTMLMHSALICNEDTLSTNIWPMAMDYSVWAHNWISDMQSGLSAIEIWPRSRFDPVSETLRNCHVWNCPTYVFEPKLQKPVVKILRWATSSRRGFNMGFRKMYSTQVGFVIKLLNC